jgi:hypothetical protein
MNDLISRQALLDKLKDFSDMYTLDEEAKVVLETIVRIVTEQPTAYDVEKVVAELEKEKEIHTEHYNISLYKDYPEVKQRYEQMQLVIDDAIAKVRKGGVE